jgi:hypothetical protein
MFPVNKDTIMMISIAIALIAVFYVYRDVQKTKLDFQQQILDSKPLPPPPPPPPQLSKKQAPPPPPPTADDTE